MMLIQLDRGCGKMIQDDPSKPWGLFRKPLCIDEPHQLLLWRPESLWWINICNGHTRSYYSDQEQQDRLAAVMVKKRQTLPKFHLFVQIPACTSCVFEIYMAPKQ